MPRRCRGIGAMHPKGTCSASLHCVGIAPYGRSVGGAFVCRLSLRRFAPPPSQREAEVSTPFLSHILFDGGDGALFQAGHLGLGDADLGGDLHLGLALAEAEGQDAALAVVQAGDGILEGDVIQPVLIGTAVVPHLIHDAEGIAAVGVHRVVQADRVAEGIHGEHHLLAGDGEVLGDLLHGGLALGVGQQGFTGAEHLIGGVAHTAADAEGAVVAEVAAYFADDHGHGVGKEKKRPFCWNWI